MKRISIWILLISPMISIAQKRFSLELLAGANQSFIQNKVFTSVALAYGFHIGLNARYDLTTNKKVSIGISKLYIIKGDYRPKTVVNYNPTVIYQTLAFLRVRSVTSLYSGLEFAIQSIDQHTNIGLVTGIRVFDNKRISMNMQMIYGFKPLLHYREFDKYGNVKDIYKLKNLRISIGVAYKIFYR